VASYFFDSSALVKRYANTLISADNALNSAAIAEGLAVDNPNHHP